MNRELLTRGTLEEQYYPRKKGNYKKIWNKTFYVLNSWDILSIYYYDVK